MLSKLIKKEADTKDNLQKTLLDKILNLFTTKKKISLKRKVFKAFTSSLFLRF